VASYSCDAVLKSINTPDASTVIFSDELCLAFAPVTAQNYSDPIASHHTNVFCGHPICLRLLGQGYALKISSNLPDNKITAYSVGWLFILRYL
jgi:hypothetical protein